MQYLFMGDCYGLESLVPYESSIVHVLKLRMRVNPQRNYVMGTIELDEDMAAAVMKSDPMDALKMIAKSPIGVLSKELEFKKAMIENVKQYEARKITDKINRKDHINEEFSKIVR